MLEMSCMQVKVGWLLEKNESTWVKGMCTVQQKGSMFLHEYSLNVCYILYFTAPDHLTNIAVYLYYHKTGRLWKIGIGEPSRAQSCTTDVEEWKCNVYLTLRCGSVDV